MKKNDEFRLIGEISSILSYKHALSGNKKNRLGDDAAVIPISPGKSMLVSTDSFYENVHFRREWSSFYEAGIKAASGAISDIYAMGGRPSHLFSAIALPSNMKKSEILDFYRGIKRICDNNNTTIDGGDTVKCSDKLFSTTLTVVGFAQTANVKLRSGARVGDIVYLTRMVGYSQAGLKLLEQGVRKGTGIIAKALKVHRAPEPSVIGTELGANRNIHAMIDVSDGLSSELWHIAKESNVSINVFSGKIDTDSDLQKLSCKLDSDVEEIIFGSGEEYALLFTAAPEWKNRYNCIEIGYVSGGGVQVFRIGVNGKKTALSKTGYNHLA
jgi:thiamine-monophosphate kinase